MKIFIEKTGKHMNLDFSGSVEKMLDKLDVNPETVLVVVDGVVVTEDVHVGGDSSVKVLSIISGG